MTVVAICFMKNLFWLDTEFNNTATELFFVVTCYIYDLYLNIPNECLCVR